MGVACWRVRWRFLKEHPSLVCFRTVWCCNTSPDWTGEQDIRYGQTLIFISVDWKMLALHGLFLTKAWSLYALLHSSSLDTLLCMSAGDGDIVVPLGQPFAVVSFWCLPSPSPSFCFLKNGQCSLLGLFVDVLISGFTKKHLIWRPRFW